MRTTILKYIFLCFLSIVAKKSFPANYPNVDELTAKYQKYNAVVSNMESLYVMDWADDSVIVTQQNSKEVVILNDFSKGLTKDFIFFGGFTTISEKEAYTLVPAGDDFDKVKVKQFQETHSIDGGIFYDDSKIMQFAYPAIQKGAITRLNYTINYSNPKFLGQSFLQSFIPIAKAKIIVKVHKHIELGFKEFNFDHIQPSYKTYKKGKYTFYEWTVEDVMPYQYYAGGFYSTSFFSPHIAFFIKSINNEPYFGTLDQLYAFYNDFINQVDKSGTEELKALVDEVTHGLTDDQEKAKAIYYWVHKNIKYIAYEEGYSGFVPMPAKEVLTKRFGDCKGMSCLIKTMMDMAGLPTYFTWVGTRHKPYRYEELPLPVVDNHMIAAQIVNDSVVLLDGTFEYLDYGVSPYHIQGKEVMIGISEDKYKIYKVPITPADYSVTSDSIKIKLVDGKVKGHDKVQYTGFNKLELAHALDGVKPEKYNQYLSHHFEMGNNKFVVTNNKIINLFEYDNPARLELKFEVSDYYKSMGDEIYLNLHLDKSYGQMIIDTTGNTFTPLENDFYCTERYITELEIPEGYEVTYMPKDNSFSNPEFEFSIQYKKTDNTVILEKELKFKFLILLEDKIGEWNKMIKTLNKSYRNTLVLKKGLKTNPNFDFK
ncbi:MULTISPECIES: DUF3857 domain-containing protein [unclassified Saccharicrinis]|uniref:DUF3857 domain-containing protein n=1 Tax=unclassified Saccharicrinis TaxID=2646859 RepID=UPI003D32E67D